MRRCCVFQFSTESISFEPDKRNEIIRVIEATVKRLQENEWKGDSEEIRIFDRCGNDIGFLKF